MAAHLKGNPSSRQRKEPVRLIALSDGLFATVLTLLVLDLRLPDTLSAQTGNLTVFLKWAGPHFFSYLLTFFVAGVYWLAHHRDFDHITDYDRGLLGYNLLFLLFIGLLPFSTASVGPGGFQSSTFRVFWAIYCANIVLAGLMLTLTWLYAVSHDQVSPDTTSEQGRHIILRQLVTPALFLISGIVQYLFPQTFLGPDSLLLIPLVQWLVDRLHAGAEPEPQAGGRAWTERLWRAGSTLLWLSIILFAAWTATL
jgi:uncharacterized membrane protein